MKLLSSLLLPALLAGCHPPKPAAVLTAPALSVAGAPAEATPVGTADGGRPSALQAVLTLTRYHWTLADAVDGKGQRIAALFVRPEKPVQLDFNASLVSVGNVCGVMSAHHAASADRLRVEPFSAAMAPCADPAVRRLDGEVAKRLQGELAMRFETVDPARLVLTNAAGDVFTFDGVDDARVAPTGG
ncbi:META domain-containing protein [Thermomonas paludicola]|uniref:META domain-containing protein n=1 Tax=Thermomonas paludicola TaxID=2884874 RepID=UPI00211568D7|nr:META domain-containing protein [Thermomonas paludicola]